ncbi:hypothetical protein SBDP1_270002 [Syntrophobacter sp. SbD1]|nr:hypothetical protein SBDP1_270002 [Syntrophobacter sp. SbD1]
MQPAPVQVWGPDALAQQVAPVLEPCAQAALLADLQQHPSLRDSGPAVAEPVALHGPQDRAPVVVAEPAALHEPQDHAPVVVAEPAALHGPQDRAPAVVAEPAHLHEPADRVAAAHVPAAGHVAAVAHVAVAAAGNGNKGRY